MKKSALLILTFCFVFVGVLAFSCPVFASGRTFGNYQTKKVHIDTSDSSVPPFSSDVYTYNFVESSDSNNYVYRWNNDTQQLSRSAGDTSTIATYDFLAYAGVSAFVPNDNPSGYEIVIRNVSGTYSAIRIGGLSIVLGSLSNTDNNRLFTFLSTPNFLEGKRAFVSVDDLSSDTWFFWVHATGAQFSNTYYYSDGHSTTSYPSYDIDITFDLLYRPYYDNYASSADIKNQTDTMTNGYDNSSMSSDNTRLNDQISQYDQAQEETTNKSTAYIDGAQFVNPFDNATVLASVTFATSFLQSLFMNLDIWQLVVTVSLCLVLALMLVGWFKFRGD